MLVAGFIDCVACACACACACAIKLRMYSTLVDKILIPSNGVVVACANCWNMYKTMPLDPHDRVTRCSRCQRIQVWWFNYPCGEV